MNDASRVVLVTGAAHGFGREIARRFSEGGDRVWACDVRGEELEETARLCGQDCRASVVDVTRSREVEAWLEEILGEVGSVDVLVNNAGGVLGQSGKPIEDVRDEEWEQIVAVNMTAGFLTSRAAAPAMKAQGSGRIVNMASRAGLSVSLTGIQAYAAAKAGLIGLTRQLSHELGPFGITVNAVAPGFVRSNPDAERQWESYGEEGQRRMVEGTALRRLGRVEDVAGAVWFLASEEASWVTGQVLSVDGGR